MGLVCEMAEAGIGSALVLEREGTITPDVKPFHEIPVGAILKLDKAGKLKFLQYASCRTVVVAGGLLRFEQDAYRLTGGITESETRGHCPRRVTLKHVGEIGGGNLRSSGVTNTLSFYPKPMFLLVGQHAEDFLSGRISAGGQDIATVPFDGPRFQWPADATPLQPDVTYELTLLPKTLGVAKVKKTFRVTPSAPQAEDAELVLLDAD
jgi:hypothetical protein